MFHQNLKTKLTKPLHLVSMLLKPRVVCNIKVMLPSAIKDSVPTNQKSCAVYKFLCRCESRYVRRATQKLADRIKENVTTSIRKKRDIVREQSPRACKSNYPKM